MTFRRSLMAALVLGAGLTLPSAHAAVTIQPGIRMWSAGLGCTTNFVYDGTGAQGGKVFVGTAAHCVEKIGDAVSDEDDVVWGRVAFIGNADATETDYAFVEVLPSALGRVSPAVKGHPGFPVGQPTVASQTNTGKKLQFSGYGTGFEFTATTREKRVGILMYDDAEIYTTTATIIYGDSGGPVIYKPTGQAIGIISRLCLGACEEEGATVQGLLAKAAARGFTARLRPAR